MRQFAFVAVVAFSAVALAADLPPRDSPQEVRLWFNLTSHGLEAALRMFELRHPGVRVITSPYFEGDDVQRFITAIAGGEPPDVVMQDRFSIGEWAARGALLSLQGPIERSMQRQRNGGPQGIDRDDFYPSCWAETVYNGQVYGVPCGSDARALFYNEDLLRRAGFVDAQGNVVPPRDWDELRRYAVALTQRGRDGQLKVLGFAPNYGNSWLFLYGILNGGQFMSPDGRRVTLDDPRIVQALNYMRDLYDAVGGVSAVEAFVNGIFTNGTTDPETDPFATGKLAMKIDGDWNLGILTEYHPNMRFGVAPPPAPRGMPSVTWSGGFAYVIPATSRNPQMAFELIRFLVSDEGWQIQHDVNARYASSRGLAYIPLMTAQPKVNDRVIEQYVQHNPYVPARVATAFPVFVRMMKSSRFRPVSPLGQMRWDEEVRAIDLAVRGRQPAAAVLRAATEKVQRQLDWVLNQTPRPPVDVARITIWIVVGLIVLTLFAFVLALRWRHYSSSEVVAAAFFVSPWVIGFTVLLIGPIIASLLYSFCRYDVLHPPQWVGAENYRRLLTDDPMFWKSLGNTAYMLIGVPLGMAVGLAIALLLNSEIRGMKVYRALFYLPSVVPLVAGSILWMWVLNPTDGLVNSMLRMAGVRHLPLWLSDPGLGLGSKAAILLMILWACGGGMVIWLAGLKGIPRHLYEAAQIDGAGPLRRFFHITIPMLSPYIFFNLVIGTIGTMQIFTQALVMTSGGPADSTMFFAYYLFNSAFRYFQMGSASAIAWVLLLMILLLTGIQMWSSRRWVQYEVV